MMGSRQEAQGALFYALSIEAHVPSDHMLRSVDRFVDLVGIRQHLAPFYSSTGRPSVDPELMIRMLLVGYIMGIRSERRLCEEVHLNLAYRWFCRLDLTDAGAGSLDLFQEPPWPLSRQRSVAPAFRNGGGTLSLRRAWPAASASPRMPASFRPMRTGRTRRRPSDRQPDRINPEDAPRAVREYLATLDDSAFGAASPVEPKFTSHSDPASQWTGARGSQAYFAYSTNYLIDTDNGVILDVEATRSIRQAEVGSVRTMIDRANDSFGVLPERLIADTAYGTGVMLDWLDRQRGIAPHILVFDKSGRRDGTFERADFTYDGENDVYTCPGGKELKQSRRIFAKPREKKPDEDGMLRYRAGKADCDACELNVRCCPRNPHAKSSGRSSSHPGIGRARSLRPPTTRSPADSGKRWRCCSHI